MAVGVTESQELVSNLGREEMVPRALGGKTGQENWEK